MAEKTELVAWRKFCREIEALGERVLSDDFPHEPADGPEAIQHLADQVVCWLGFSIGHSDPASPFFHRSNDLVTQWGGPNQDNVYHHARIDPSLRYRIRGRMHSCEHFVLTLRAGFMHNEVWGTRETITSESRGIETGQNFEILIGGDGSDPAFTPIPEGVIFASLREYYTDWQPREPAVFTIECLDDRPAPPRPSGEFVAAQLDTALGQVRDSMEYWNTYMREERALGTDNELREGQVVAKGLQAARYAFLFWDLAPDEMVLIESDVPDARYWGLQLYSLSWFEQVDAINRVTTINQHQMRIDADGRFRVVLAHEDPGVPNWLDTGGRREGLLTYRWFWPNSDPSPTTRLVSRDELAGLMPAETPRVDEAARRAEIRSRKEHLAWRFHT